VPSINIVTATEATPSMKSIKSFNAPAAPCKKELEAIVFSLI
jgi:hypothetical protein